LKIKKMEKWTPEPSGDPVIAVLLLGLQLETLYCELVRTSVSRSQ
jgi:hypothetical protein